MEEQQINLKAILLATFGYFLFSLGDSGNKLMAGGYHPFIIMFWGSIFSLITVCAYGYLRNNGFSFLKTRPENTKFHVMRGLLSVVTGGLIITALKTIQMDEFYVVIFTSPLWLALLGRILLGDRINIQRLSALVMGFVVVLFVMRPEGDVLSFGTILTAIAAFTGAISMILIRCMTPAANDKFLFAISGPVVAIFCLGAYIFSTDMFVVPATNDMLIILVCSFCFSGGAIATGVAYQRATSVSAVAPFHYTQMIWGIVLGYLIFADMPTYDVVIGSLMIVATGIFMIRAEGRSVDQREKELEYLFDLAE